MPTTPDRLPFVAIGDKAFASCTSPGRADFFSNTPDKGTDAFTDTATSTKLNTSQFSNVKVKP